MPSYLSKLWDLSCGKSGGQTEQREKLAELPFLLSPTNANLPHRAGWGTKVKFLAQIISFTLIKRTDQKKRGGLPVAAPFSMSSHYSRTITSTSSSSTMMPSMEAATYRSRSVAIFKTPLGEWEAPPETGSLEQALVRRFPEERQRVLKMATTTNRYSHSRQKHRPTKQQLA